MRPLYIFFLIFVNSMKTQLQIFVKTALLIACLLCSSLLCQILAQVKLGGVPPVSPHTLLELESTNKGLLLTRMTTAQRNNITPLVNGLVIYNTDNNCIEYTDTNARWHSLCEDINTSQQTADPCFPGNQQIKTSVVYLDIPQKTAMLTATQVFEPLQGRWKVVNGTAGDSILFSNHRNPTTFFHGNGCGTTYICAWEVSNASCANKTRSAFLSIFFKEKNAQVDTIGSPSNITVDEAEVSSDVQLLDTVSILERGFVYDILPNSDFYKKTVADTTGVLSATLTNLKAYTTYYVRPYVKTSECGMIYGPQQIFTTLCIQNPNKITLNNGFAYYKDADSVAFYPLIYNTDLYIEFGKWSFDFSLIDGQFPANAFNQNYTQHRLWLSKKQPISQIDLNKYFYIAVHAANDYGLCPVSDTFRILIADTGFYVSANWEGSFGTFVDKRDKKQYRTVKMPDNNWWLAQNLNYQKGLSYQRLSTSPCNPVQGNDPCVKSSFWCPGNDGDSNRREACNTWGALYAFSTAVSLNGIGNIIDNKGNIVNPATPDQAVRPLIPGICPQGWHVADDREWGNMLNHLEPPGGTQNHDYNDNTTSGYKGSSSINSAGTRFKSAENGTASDTIAYNKGNGMFNGSDQWAFSGFPTGRRTALFENRGTDIYFWSSSQHTADSAWIRHRELSRAMIERNFYPKSYALPVRCVSDTNYYPPFCVALPMDTSKTTDITYKDAVLWGRLIDNENLTILEKGFIYDTTPMPWLNGTRKTAVSANDTAWFSVKTDSLRANKTYYFVAYVKNECESYSYSSTVEFTTLCIPHNDKIAINSGYVYARNADSVLYDALVYAVDRDIERGIWSFSYAIDQSAFSPAAFDTMQIDNNILVSRKRVLDFNDWSKTFKLYVNAFNDDGLCPIHDSFDISLVNCAGFHRQGLSVGSFASFVDCRDNKQYRAVLMPDNNWWMAENLNYQGDAGSVLTFNPNSRNTCTSCFWCPGGTPVGGRANSSDIQNCNVWGALYTFGTSVMLNGTGDIVDFEGNIVNLETPENDNQPKIQGVCPPGWYLPDDRTFGNMLNMVETAAGIQNHRRTVNNTVDPVPGHENEEHLGSPAIVGAGHKIKSTAIARPRDLQSAFVSELDSTAGTDSWGFSALPAGLRTWYPQGNEIFEDRGLGGFFWTSNTHDNLANSWCRYIFSEVNQVTRAIGASDYGMSIRCVKLP